jgi:hypothetical protein
LNFLKRFSKKNYSYSDLMKIRPMGIEVFHADGRTGVTKLLVVFLNFVKAPTKNHTTATRITLSLFPVTPEELLLSNCSKAFFVYSNTLLGRDNQNRKCTTNLLPDTTLYYCRTGTAQPI